jgi:hypothetical protein
MAAPLFDIKTAEKRAARQIATFLDFEKLSTGAGRFL